MTMSKVAECEGRDKYEPIKRLAMAQTQPARKASKPFTSFCIKDILGTNTKDQDKTLHSFSIRYQLSQQQVGIQGWAHKHATRGGKHCQHSDSDATRGGKHCQHSDSDARHRAVNHTDKIHRELLNLCRLDRVSEGVRALSPALRSNPVNGCFRLSQSKLSQRHVDHREQPGQQTLPMNMSTKIVRPWDTHLDTFSPSCNRTLAATSCIPVAMLTASEPSSGEDEEEISVDDEERPSRIMSPRICNNSKSVSPLDALMAMTSKTFEGLDGAGPADTKRREQTTLFGKHQQSKKRRKSRTAFTNQQIYELEKRFLYQKYLTPADRDEIATSLGLTNAQVITWFQNRRAKLKRDLEELKNDVTAAKKLPLQKSVPDSVIELRLRKAKGQTPRESCSNSDVHSPVSMVSVTEEVHDMSNTPGASPCHVGVDGEHDVKAVSGGTQKEAMDTSFVDDVNEETHGDVGDNHVTDDNNQGIKSGFLRDNDNLQTQLRDFKKHNEISLTNEKTIKREHNGGS